MPSEHRLDLTPATTEHGMDFGYGAPAAYDSKCLAIVFHLVEEICEVPGGIRCAYLRHGIRLSDFYPDI